MLVASVVESRTPGQHSSEPLDPTLPKNASCWSVLILPCLHWHHLHPFSHTLGIPSPKHPTTWCFDLVLSLHPFFPLVSPRVHSGRTGYGNLLLFPSASDCRDARYLTTYANRFGIAAYSQISPLVPLRSRTTVQAGRERFSVGHSLNGFVSEKEVLLFDLKEVISQRRHSNGAVSIQKSPEDGRPRVCFSVPSDLPPFQEKEIKKETQVSSLILTILISKLSQLDHGRREHILLELFGTKSV